MTASRFVPRLVCTFYFSLFSVAIAALGQTAPPAAQPGAEPAATFSTGSIRIDVVAETKAGQPVTDLSQQDFTVLDNKAARSVTSFKKMTPADEPVKVILLIDAVNTPYSTVAFSRDGIEKFLKANEGQLANPTSVAVLTDKGVELDNGFSTNGISLADQLEHRQIALREITRSSQWGGVERMQLCINALHQLIAFSGSLPGRKILIWVSPGWPLISGPRVSLDPRQQKQIFNEIMNLSTQMREVHLTVYNPNPVGVTESIQAANYYQSFLKGVAKPNDAQFANVSIQVLAAQTGGLVMEGNSDVAGMIARCLLDAKSWYEIGFDPMPPDKPDEYHHIEVKVDRPGVVARTRDGYYANPVAIPAK
jgi:VWFA-related protein